MIQKVCRHACVIVASMLLVAASVNPAAAQPQACEGTLLGSFGGATLGIAEAGDLAYLASSGGGLTIVDAADPASPRYLSSLLLNGNAQSVTVRDSIVYATVINAPISYLVAVDASDPSAPFELGRVEVPRDARQVVLSGDTAVVACDDFGIQMVDISAPSDPVLVGALITQGQPASVYIDGDIAFIADTERLVIADVSDPSNPVIVSELQGFDRAFWVDGDGDGHVYVADRGLQQLIAVDARDPASPAITDREGPIAVPSGMVYRDGRVYLPGLYEGLYVLNVNNPDAIQVEQLFRGSGGLYSAALHGNHIMVSGDDVELAILDISAPGIGLIEELARLSLPNEARAVAVRGELVYIADHSGGLRIADLRDPAAPEVISTVQLAGQTYDMQLVGDLAYMSCGVGIQSGSLQIVDIADHESPSIIGVVETSKRVSSALVDDDWAYALLEGAGFAVIDVSYPSNPEVVYTREVGIDPEGIALRHGVLYISEGTRGIRIYDVSDPASPVLVSTYTGLTDPREMIIRGDFAYVTQWFQGLGILDLTDPYSPGLVSTIDNNTITTSTRPELYDDAVYICGNNLGIIGIDVSNPAQPFEFAHFGGMPRAFGLAVDGSRMYIAGDASGIHTLEVPGCPYTCEADFDLDATVDAQDAFAFLAAFLDEDLHADFNHDVRLDYFDISAFIDAYRLGCP